MTPLHASMDSSYRDIQTQLDSGRIPDSTAIDRLPDPETPAEKWLKSRVTTRIDSSLALIQAAIRESESDEDKVTYLKEWVRISLLMSPEAVEGEFAVETLSGLRPGGSVDGELWYLAGQLARHTGNLRRANRRFGRVDKRSSYFDRSLLARASVQLERGRPTESSRLLDRYFLSPSTDERPLYWVIRGRVFEETGADSEAYIAYSHVINHYTRSLSRPMAERRISNLPLPEALYPNQQDDQSDLRGEPSVRASTPEEQGGAFGIQVGSFRDRVHARRLRQSLQSLTDYAVEINQSTVDGQQYHRVQVVDIPSRQEAKSVLSQLKTSGHDGFIVTP